MMRLIAIVGIAFCLAAPGKVFAQADDPKKDKPGGSDALITPATEKAIADGLAYLVREQAADGSWGTGQFQSNVAITSLAGLAFLASGAQVGMGKYGQVLQKAVEFVLSQEEPGMPGFFNSRKIAIHGPMYNHGFGVLFLAEVHGAIAEPKLRRQVREALERAATVTLKAQNHEGGWRYRPHPGDADLTVSCGQLQALRAAQRAGIDVPNKALDQAVRYVKTCQLSDEGGFRYQSIGGAPGFARTAAGVAALLAGGAAPTMEDWKLADKAIAYLLRFKPGKEDLLDHETRIHYFYGHFYAAQGMWAAGDHSGREWYAAIRDELL